MSEFEGKSGKWAWEIQKEQQAKVEELQKQLSEYIFVSETLDEMYVKEVQKSDELQKRINKAKEIANELMQSVENYKLGELLEKVLNGDLDEVSKT
ncbi:hypothetical protein ACSUAV_13775 [Acinetobacter baumannii]